MLRFDLWVGTLVEGLLSLEPSVRDPYPLGFIFVGDVRVFASIRTSSLKLRLRDPDDPGRDRDFHGLGDSCVANGEGSGVMSGSAFSAGELMRDPLGDSEYCECMLAADSVERRLPPRWMGIGFDDA